MNIRHPAVIVAAVAFGIAFIVLGIIYWVEPAGSLPSWIRGMRRARVTITSSTG
jgi:ABC-type multidrug transport system permease subunit